MIISTTLEIKVHCEYAIAQAANLLEHGLMIGVDLVSAHCFHVIKCGDERIVVASLGTNDIPAEFIQFDFWNAGGKSRKAAVQVIYIRFGNIFFELQKDYMLQHFLLRLKEVLGYFARFS